MQKRPMKAVILAAGEGKRLRPLTESIPKPMVPVGGMPVLEYTLGILPEEVEEVVLVVGYRNEVIRDYFGASFGGRRLIYVEQPELKGTGDALLRAKPFLGEDPFLVLYADDLYRPDDLAACVAGGLRVLVKESAHPERFGVCLTDEDGRLLKIIEKRPDPPSNLVNIGVYFLDKNIFDEPLVQLPNGEYNLAEQIGAMAARHHIHIERARFWHPIGYPEDIPVAEQFLKAPLSARKN